MKEDLNFLDYYLPEEKIAKYPLKKRNHSKLLIYKNGIIIEDTFKNIYKYIEPSTLMIFNNTKVIPARIKIKKETGACIEIFLLNPIHPSNYKEAFKAKYSTTWKCIVGNLRRWKSEKLFLKTKIKKKITNISFCKKISSENEIIIEINWDQPFTFLELIKKIGKIPIPPYLKRDTEEIDEYKYQTIFSKFYGSVAAPTASLHFTKLEFKNLIKKGINIDFLTLHVGAGTFKPISSNICNHIMHTEEFCIKTSLIKKIIKYYPNIIAVGTTSLRALESIYHYANIELYKNNTFHIEQWIKKKDNTIPNVINTLTKFYFWLKTNKISNLKLTTQLMITHTDKIIMTKALITNFHLPKSTLLALVAAYVGENWKKIYNYALNHNFRFLSYGDASLLFKENS